MPSLVGLVPTTSGNSTDGGTSTDRLNDRINFISSTIIIPFFYGITTILYFITMYYLVKRLSRRNPLSRPSLTRRKTLFYVVYSSVMFVLATLYTASVFQTAVVTYVDNRLYPGGPYQYYLRFIPGQTSFIISTVTPLIMIWMADGLIVSRFIMFYRNVPYLRWIILLLCFIYLAVIALSTLTFYALATSRNGFFLPENLLIIYYVLSFSLNLLSTVLIAGRLYWYKIQLQRVFGSSITPPYMGFATLLIESASLYCIWSLMAVVTGILGSPFQPLILATLNDVEIIPSLLMILGIARGTAWNDSHLQEDEGGVTVSPDQNWQVSSNRTRRFNSIGSRPARVPVADGEPDMDVFHPMTVAENGARYTGDGGLNVIELGLYDSTSSSNIDTK